MRSLLVKTYWAALLAILIAVPVLSSSGWARDKKKESAPQIDQSKRALHALNRLTFGPSPGDVEKVEAMGVDKWIDLQLHPERIDNSALDARLAPFRTLHMDTYQIVENFPPPQLLKQVANGKLSLPKDPEQRAMYEAALERYKQKRQNKAAKNGDAKNANALDGDTDEETKMFAELKSEELLKAAPEERVQQITAMDPNERLVMFRGLDQDERQQMLQGLNPKQREGLQAMVNPQQVVVNELMQAKLLRAAYSERQLQEVMTDFWFNHFNVFLNKGADRYLITSYERDVIRPLAFGKFKDLLVATAESPAMLFYLDNWQSVGPDSERVKMAKRRQNRRPDAKAPRISGLNENYAREIMELHTLGVDGGYTQKDVTELAKVLTGWTIDRPQLGGQFKFDERMHEPGTKKVLGHKIKEHGMKEGLEMLDVLAHHPATAHFISKKLAMRFVSDDPPPALVDRMAQTFKKSDGDIREVLRTMFNSPEFWSPQTYRAKIKTPLEFVVSAVRASGADIQNAQPLVAQLNRLGMPLYGMQPPTGYSMKAETWVNSSALLNRMNFGLALGAGRLPGVAWKPPESAVQAPDVGAAVTASADMLLGGDVSKQTEDTVLKELTDPEIEKRAGGAAAPARLAAGLLLGSPEFQRR